MQEVKSILMVGVGGQGTILASNVLAEGLLKSGYDVKMSEVHGMSQRGGSVNTQIRFGEKVYSPVIEVGAADVIVAFEKMEAVRWLNYLKKRRRCHCKYGRNTSTFCAHKQRRVSQELN